MTYLATSYVSTLIYNSTYVLMNKCIKEKACIMNQHKNLNDLTNIIKDYQLDTMLLILNLMQ